MPVDEGGVTYLFALSDGATIDGSDGGNATRYINHSCRPNCVA
jgi:SET domain-containing protein